MQVSKMLLTYEIDHLFQEVESLCAELQGNTSSEGVTLGNFIDRKIRQIHGLQVTLSFLENKQEEADLADMCRMFRQIKLELRLCKRKWQRIKTMENRLRKAQEKVADVAPLIA